MLPFFACAISSEIFKSSEDHTAENKCLWTSYLCTFVYVCLYVTRQLDESFGIPEMTLLIAYWKEQPKQSLNITSRCRKYRCPIALSIYKRADLTRQKKIKTLLSLLCFLYLNSFHHEDVHHSVVYDDFLNIHTDNSYGEGNGNPLWYSCLENPMDGEAW